MLLRTPRHAFSHNPGTASWGYLSFVSFVWHTRAGPSPTDHQPCRCAWHTSSRTLSVCPMHHLSAKNLLMRFLTSLFSGRPPPHACSIQSCHA